MARLGEKWALLILASLEQGQVRFGAMRRRIEGVSQKMLTQTLRNLDRDGLVERRLHDERPLRVTYELTDRGRDLLPLARDLKAWAERHLHGVEQSNALYDRAAAARPSLATPRTSLPAAARHS